MSTPRWHGTTAQERAGERRRRLLDAGRELMADGGAAAVTVRAVTRSSGVSPRLFYESFPDRDTLLLALWDEQYGLLADRVEGAIADAGPELAQRLRAAVLVTAHWFSEQPWRAVVMLRETLAEELLRRHARRRLPEMVLSTAARSVDAELLAGVSPTALEVAVVGLSGAIVNLFLEWTGGGLDVTAEQLADEIVELMVGALLRLTSR